jgi:hypothetical protein
VRGQATDRWLISCGRRRRFGGLFGHECDGLRLLSGNQIAEKMTVDEVKMDAMLADLSNYWGRGSGERSRRRISMYVWV